MDIKEQAVKNLKEFKEIADLCGMRFMLGDGTLLGAFTDKDFLPDDENDIDLCVMESEFHKFGDVENHLLKNGFTNTKRVDVRGEFHGGCWARGDNHIDVMKMIKDGDVVYNIGERGLLRYEYPAEIFDKYSQIEFMGMAFDAPGDIQAFLEARYSDWRRYVPKEIYDYANPVFSPNVKKLKLAVYTLTRDRLDYTKRFLDQLVCAGYDFDHFIYDNGSTDGTDEFLTGYQSKWKYLSPVNKGLWHGIKEITEATNCFEGYDLVLKLDNDMEFPQDGWLRELLLAYLRSDFDIISPFVEGICGEAGGPQRITSGDISQTAHVGGACMLSRPDLYKKEIPLDRAKARGFDTWFCERQKCGVAEHIHVKHDTLSQEREKPDYYARKIKESKECWKSTT